MSLKSPSTTSLDDTSPFSATSLVRILNLLSKYLLHSSLPSGSEGLKIKCFPYLSEFPQYVSQRVTYKKILYVSAESNSAGIIWMTAHNY